MHVQNTYTRLEQVNSVEYFQEHIPTFTHSNNTYLHSHIPTIHTYIHTFQQCIHTPGAGAVNSVDEYFKQKAEDTPHRWVPGDTQKISALPALGTTTTDSWTSNPLIYGQQGTDRVKQCLVYCPSCSVNSIGWSVACVYAVCGSVDWLTFVCAYVCVCIYIYIYICT